MANVFVKDRAASKNASVSSGDVLYLTDTNEVFDILSSKLSVVSSNVVFVKSGLWAALNTAKSLRRADGNKHDAAQLYQERVTLYC